LSAVADPLDMYELGLSGALEELRVRFAGGGGVRLDVDRWLGPADAADAAVLERVLAPVLDVGCGPGRHVVSCIERGIPVLGIDVSTAAVLEARRRGAEVLEGSVFSSVPEPGKWGSALLLDGNIGIGGDPAALLARVGALLRADGRVLVEVGAPGTPTRRERARIEHRGARSAWFPWARVALDGLGPLARAGGMDVVANWEAGGRWFARVDRAA